MTDERFSIHRARPLRRFCRGLAVLVATLSLVPSRAAETPPDFRPSAPLPAVRQAAEVVRMPLAGFSAPHERVELRPGDAITAIITVEAGKEQRQWALALHALGRAAGEKEPAGRRARFFSSSGYEFVFGSRPAALEIRILGPLTAADAGKRAATAPEVKRRKIVVSGDYLGLGLDRVPATALRVRAAKAANPDLPSGNLSLGSKPFPSDVVAANRKIAEAVGITEADERAMAGSVLAMIEFFQVALRTPGLQEVLQSVLDVPWWSIIRSGGKMPDIYFEALPFQRALDAAEWGLASDAKVYALPFLLRLNGAPALLFQLAVTAPRPPLLASAGIVGLAAGRPDGKGPVLTLQLVAAHAAGETSAPAAAP